MSGPNSTSGNIPYTTSQPVTPSQPPSQGQSGVNSLGGQRYIPESESKPSDISIHMRTPRVQKGVLPQVNREKAIDQLQSSYKAHYAQAEAKRDWLDLAHSLKEIRHYLDNPALTKECTSYSIMWIPDEGEPISVIPPGTELNDRAKATEIRGMLQGQLDKLDQKFTVSKLQQLEEEIVEQDGLMQLAAQQLHDMGEPLPVLPPRERIVFLGGTSTNRPSVPGQQPTPSSVPHPETGQHTPPTPAPTPRTEPPSQPLESEEMPPLPGRFELRLKKSDVPPLQPVVVDEDDEEESWANFEDEPSSPTTEQRRPDRPLPPETPPLMFDDEKLQTPLRPQKQRNEETQPLIQFEDEDDPDLDFDPLANQPIPQTSSPWEIPGSDQKPSPNIAIPRQKVRSPAPGIVGNLSSPSLEDDEPTYLLSYLSPEGSNQPARIFRQRINLDDEPMASVNSGTSRLNLVDEEQGLDAAGLQFTRKLRQWANPDLHDRFHKRMLESCDYNIARNATEDDLAHSPGLAASRILKSDLKGDGKNTGTIILDVFKDKFPNGNSANRAMIYVVPPNAEDYDNPKEFLANCAETAKRLTWTLHSYNMHVRDLHQQGKGQDLEEIPTLRTGAFGSYQTKFPQIPPSVVADIVTRGITAQLGAIKGSGEPETILKVELDDTSGVFSRKNTPPPAPPAPIPTVTTPPQQPLVSEPVTPIKHPPAPSPIALTLQHCSQELSARLENDRENLARLALNSTFDHKNRNRPVEQAANYTGPLHATRKAMLSRAMVNLHRKHAMAENTQVRDALHIPDRALPVVEMGVLFSTPDPQRVMTGTRQALDASRTLQKLRKLQVPQDAATLVAYATNGVSGGQPNLLDIILRDVEKIESMRNKAIFDIAELDSYSLLPDSEARTELVKLCTEYRDLLKAHGELEGGKSEKNQRYNDFELKENGTSISKSRPKLEPGFRANAERVDDLYTKQLGALDSNSKFSELYHYSYEK